MEHYFHHKYILADAQKEFAKIGDAGGLLNKMGSNLSNMIMTTVKKELEESRAELEELDFDISMITGEQKNLSTALYDVSKDRGIESEGLLYLIKALPDLEAFLYSTSVQKYYRDHTEHALRVAVLGDFLLEQDLGQGNLMGIISDLTGLDKNLLKDKFWWVTGLIHDIGYPLGKIHHLSYALPYKLYLHTCLFRSAQQTLSAFEKGWHQPESHLFLKTNQMPVFFSFFSFN